MSSKSPKTKQAANSRSKPPPAPHTPPVQNPPTTSSSEMAKKKKKKKNKAKATPVVSEPRVEFKYEDEDEDEEDDDIPPLEPAPGLYRSLTGLPPELEAVHLSATASLSATVAAAAKSNPTAAAHAELIAAADDLCRRMDADPQGGIATDDDYWKSLPEHIRNFAQAMYAIAQKMVQSSGSKGPTRGVPGYPPGAFPSSNLPFDQSILSRSPFDALMEQAVAPYLPTSNSPPSSRVHYSEDEQDCDEEDGEEEVISRDERVSNSPLPPQQPPPLLPSQHTPRTSEKTAGMKTSGNSNNTNVSSGGGGGGQPPEFAALPALAGTVPGHSPAPVSVTTNAAMPPTSRVPPPSSRAAGKQPMNYASQQTNPNPPTSTTRSARAASKQPLSAANYPHNPTHHHPSPPSSNASGPHKNRQNAPTNSQSPKNNKIWSTSSTEERERIKEFWLGLGEEERRNLVKVEKEAVLKKMKEQQKHSCSCAVCGRKRNAIEDELEVLYDAYYEELEQYANYQQRYVSSGGTLPPPPGPGPFPGSVELDKNGAVVGHHKPQPPSSHPNLRSKNPPITAVPNGRGPKAQVKHPESEFEDDQDEDEYEEDDEYEAEEDDEEDEDEDDGDGDGDGEDGDGRHPRVTSRRAGAPTSTRRRTTVDAKPERDKLFNFGSSLTVTDNILTVADDLLKNDGQKFLEMMEQLADRRMIREDRATASIEDDSEEDDGDDDGDDDEDEEDEDDEDEEEEEPMTEDQKVEEGKKMFSIFAARMFEQRVLQAYREQVAQERQLQLLRELEDEDKATKEKEARKQTQNQKKKDKKKQQKLAKEGEKAAKAAEKAAEDALLKAKQQALEEEQKKKREEERAKREATRKAQEEEKQRKDEERRKRQTEEKERQAEQERKRKEREEKLKQERREKEDRDRKVKEEREAKERVAAATRREQQEKEERERKTREEERGERERLEKEKADKEKEARAAQQSRKQNVRPPPSPRNASASGSTQGPPQPQTTPKKILSKSASTGVISPVPAVSRQNSQPRPVIITNQPIPQTPPQSSNPPTPGYSPGLNGAPPQQNPLVSPRVPFNPLQQFNGFVSGPAIPQQGQGPILGPSPLPRNFGAPGFDSYPARPIGTPAIVSPGPIGPPQKMNSNPPPPSMLAPGSGRRQSIIADPGPIGPPRPIQPIARPTEQSGSGSASPVRRSPSPKVLGSSALATDDDEVVPTSRRPVVNGPVWGAASVPPRPSVDLRGPWGPPPPGFPIQPNLPRPPVGPSPWGTSSPNDQWHPSNFFPPGQFVGHNPSPPPHPGN